MNNPSSLSLIKLIQKDFQSNKRNWKGFFILFLYRLAHYHLSSPVYAKPFTFVYLVFYKIFTEVFIGTEIHWRCVIGHSARVYHAYGMVIHSDTKIGHNVVLRHGVTIGSKEINGIIFSPAIGDYCDIGASAIILGKIKIGNHVVIGAGTVVVKNIPDNATVVGNPSRIIRVSPEPKN